MSISRLSSGAGYQYLTRTTACGDCAMPAGTSPTDYYTASGNPPGRWYGAGLAGLGSSDGGLITVGEQVTEEQMKRLYGSGCDPITGAPLGRGYPVFVSLADRVTRQVAALPEAMTAAARAEAVQAITQAEATRPAPHAVAGFDLTFSARKSVSVLWALGDDATRAAVLAAHHRALAEVLAYAESAAVFTRTGKHGAAQVVTRGAIAAAFDHWDTRTGDPQLHTHVVIANKVQGQDGAWRSLDSRALHHAAVTLSELYDNVLADHVSASLTASWGFRSRGERRSPGFELDGIDDTLIGVFSTRTTDIDAAFRSLVTDFAAGRGRAPTRVEVTRLRQQATLATRPAKSGHRLVDQFREWADRARANTGRAPREITADVLASDPARLLTHDQIATTTVQRLAVVVLDAVAERRSTFSTWAIRAEVHRATRGLRMATAGDRIALSDRVTAAVQDIAVRVTPDDPVPVTAGYTRPDGSSVFTRAGMDTFTHPALLDAEARLLDTHLHDDAAPFVRQATAQRIATTPQPPRTRGGSPVRLADDQVAAVTDIATSGRRIDVLVGPAGTGKTTTLAALRTAWEATYGQGSVIGLAPSATAAHELATALGIGCENTAKWLHESVGDAAETRAAARDGLTSRARDAAARGDLASAKRSREQVHALDAETARWTMGAGQLVIVDEASLAGTLDLDRLRAQATASGAKLLLVGDHAQLSSVDAGGGFALLAERGNPSELTSLWRFRARWEANATRALRRGDPAVIDTYRDHGRLHAGDPDLLLEDAYTSWAADTEAGISSLLIAPDHDTVTALNDRAHADRVAAGTVHGPVVALGDTGCGGARGSAGTGDLVLTRRNDRRMLLADGTHVRNGDLWSVTAVHPDGALTVTRAHHEAEESPGGGEGSSEALVLPAEYVAGHVDPGYATTAHRAQGLTVETAHVLIHPGMTREALYVAMTRGRTANHGYVSTLRQDEGCGTPTGDAPPATAREVLTTVLATRGSLPSATQALDAERDERSSLRRLVPIRDSLHADSDRQRADVLLPLASLTDDQAASVLASPAAGPLMADLRRTGLDDEHAAELLQQLIVSRPLPAISGDIASVLHHRLETWAEKHDGEWDASGSRTSDMAASRLALLEPGNTSPGELGRTVACLDELIAQRVQSLGAAAIRQRPTWLPPIAATEGHDAEAVETVAAYLDLRGGPEAASAAPATTNRMDRRRRSEAVDAFHCLRNSAQPPQTDQSRSLHR